MGERTGRPRGRPKGAKNRRTEERQAALQEAAQVIEGILPEPFHGDSHALLMTIYKDTSKDIELRLDAAKAAIGYEKPRLAAVEHSGEMKLSHEQAIEDLEERMNGSDEHEHAH